MTIVIFLKQFLNRKRKKMKNKTTGDTNGVLKIKTTVNQIPQLIKSCNHKNEK